MKNPKNIYFAIKKYVYISCLFLILAACSDQKELTSNIQQTIPEPAASPISEPAASPIPKPAASPIPEPAASPIPKPAASPIPEPAASSIPEPAASSDKTDAELIDSQQILKNAYNNRQSDIQIKGEGRVTRILSDDIEGSQHQRFILELTSGQTLLIAHNIDLAPKILDIKLGDTVTFFGEYEWNAQGGVIHWTHKDPSQKHEDGWLKHKDRIYQ